jgi:hypothetical protein
VPSYLTAETADHIAGSVMTCVKTLLRARAGRVWNWLMERAGEFAGEPPLPRHVTNSKVTGALHNEVVLLLVVSFLLAAVAVQASENRPMDSR